MFEGPLRYVIVLAVAIIVLRIVLQISNAKYAERMKKANQHAAEFVQKETEQLVEIGEKARETYPLFVEEFRKAPNPQSYSVKMRFDADEGKPDEHLWVEDLWLDGERLFGKVANDPLDVSRLELGDVVELERERISDWRFVKDGLIYGGWILYEIMNDFTPEQKAELEGLLGGKFSEKAILPSTEVGEDV